MSRFGQLALLVAVISASTLPATAQSQWAWRDKSKNNQITYSDMAPPADISEADILKRPNNQAKTTDKQGGAPMTAAPPAPRAAAPALLPPKLVDPRLEAKRKQAEQEAEAAKKAEEAKQATVRAANCERATNALRALESGVRISRPNAKGEPEILDDKAREAETKRTQEIAKSECMKP